MYKYEDETWSEYFTRRLAVARALEALAQYYKEKQNSTHNTQSTK
jgi:hypothetical protein